MDTSPTPAAREQHGFQRTVCGCEYCRAPCRHMPGSLDVADLESLCPAGQDVFAWAEQHLRALVNKPYPTLVPARQANGHCHWLYEGRCVVHDRSPYGCAFFDRHMSEAEAQRRADATIQARQADAARNGLYHRVWLHLRRKGLVSRPGDRDGLAQETLQIHRYVERQATRDSSC